VWLDLKISSGVFDVWRVMDFGRRSGPDKPKAQMFEDGADDRRVLDAADDPHGAVTLRTDQGIYLVDVECHDIINAFLCHYIVNEPIKPGSSLEDSHNLA